MRVQLLSMVITLIITETLAVSKEDIVKWKEYKVKYTKIYKSNKEEQKRRDIFVENLGNIRDHNQKYEKGDVSYTLGINQFSDMTDEEFSSTMLCLPLNPQSNGLPMPDLSDYEPPKELDWRTKGAVTRVKSQGHCGSCWAFSTTGTLEGSHFLKTKQLVSLSEQQLVDCDSRSYGCDGGFPSWALDYVKENDGIASEQSYPYKGRDMNCNYQESGKAATCRGYVNVTSGDEESLKKAVAKFGPISILFDARPPFREYNDGIYESPGCDSNHLSHAMLLVGYGTENGKDYWLVKNSWATTFGMDGYVKTARNKNNMCGIATFSLYPIV